MCCLTAREERGRYESQAVQLDQQKRQLLLLVAAVKTFILLNENPWVLQKEGISFLIKEAMNVIHCP